MLKPAHAELPLVFMIVLTQVSVGGFLALFYGYIMTLLQGAVLAIGIYAIYAQSMIYRVKARPSWDRSSTNKKFFGVGYVGFLLTAFVMLINGADRSVMAILALTLLFGVYQIFVIYEETIFYKHLDKDHPNYYQLSRTKKLLEENFGKFKNIRLITLAIFALAFPLLAIVFTASGLLGFALSLLGIAIIGALGSEFLGRYLFFVTVVPLGLAGNFFAGNQRV